MDGRPDPTTRISGVVLAGGRARRMGGVDKGLVPLSGRPMIEYVLAAIRPQVSAVFINANRNREQYERYGYPVIADTWPDFAGPLAGMASCMPHIETELMLTVPCDSPFVPVMLAARLLERLQSEDAEICMAHNGERTQPVFSLMKVELLPSVESYLKSGERKIDRWYSQHRTVEADFSDQPRAFVNMNAPGDIREAEPELNRSRHV